MWKRIFEWFLIGLLIVGTLAGIANIFLGIMVVDMLKDIFASAETTQGFVPGVTQAYSYEFRTDCFPLPLDPAPTPVELVPYSDISQGIKGTSWADHQVNIFFEEDGITVLDIATGLSWTFKDQDFYQPCEWHELQGIRKVSQGNDVFWFIPIGDQLIELKETNGIFEVQRAVYSEDSGLGGFKLQQFTPEKRPDPNLNQQA